MVSSRDKSGYNVKEKLPHSRKWARRSQERFVVLLWERYLLGLLIIWLSAQVNRSREWHRCVCVFLRCRNMNSSRKLLCYCEYCDFLWFLRLWKKCQQSETFTQTLENRRLWEREGEGERNVDEKSWRMIQAGGRRKIETITKPSCRIILAESILAFALQCHWATSPSILS